MYNFHNKTGTRIRGVGTKIVTEEPTIRSLDTFRMSSDFNPNEVYLGDVFSDGKVIISLRLPDAPKVTPGICKYCSAPTFILDGVVSCTGEDHFTHLPADMISDPF